MKKPSTLASSGPTTTLYDVSSTTEYLEGVEARRACYPTVETPAHILTLPLNMTPEQVAFRFEIFDDFTPDQNQLLRRPETRASSEQIERAEFEAKVCDEWMTRSPDLVRVFPDQWSDPQQADWGKFIATSYAGFFTKFNVEESDRAKVTNWMLAPLCVAPWQVLSKIVADLKRCGKAFKELDAYTGVLRGQLSDDARENIRNELVNQIADCYKNRPLEAALVCARCDYDAVKAVGRVAVEIEKALKEKSQVLLTSSSKAAVVPPGSPLTDNRRFLLEWGSYSAVVGVETALEKLHEKIAIFAPVGAAPTVMVDVFLRLASAWANAGFPLLVLGHKLAASMMATDVSPAAVDDVAIPWPVFLVAVPDGLFGSAFTHNTYPRFVGLAHDAGGIHFVIVSNAMLFMHESKVASLSELFDLVPETRGDEASGRVFPFLVRLLVGSMIELDHPDRKDIVEREPSEKHSRRNDKRGPRAWTFELRREVSVDLRGWVHDQLDKESRTRSGGFKPSAVQYLVRGHHKRQACGPGALLRKWITIEPYWKGDRDAPIAMRPHVLKKPESE